MFSPVNNDLKYQEQKSIKKREEGGKKILKTKGAIYLCIYLNTVVFI